MFFFNIYALLTAVNTRKISPTFPKMMAKIYACKVQAKHLASLQS